MCCCSALLYRITVVYTSVLGGVFWVGGMSSHEVAGIDEGGSSFYLGTPCISKIGLTALAFVGLG